MSVNEQIQPESIARAADAVSKSRSLVITAGAGMGIDSGLPDFRGDQGFWNAYPLYEKLGFSFIEMANPRHFVDDPHFAWGFYGHRCLLYREATPHIGFEILRRWIDRYKLNWHVVTSNVDGQFQKAGFDTEKVLEVHGSLHHLQCQEPCKPRIWENHEVFEIDLESMRAKHVPICNQCQGTARPNVLMFNDWAWISRRTQQQQSLFEQFAIEASKPITIIEFGAGRAIPTIRWMGENLAQGKAATMIRINPREPQISAPHISMASGAVDALMQIEAALART